MDKNHPDNIEKLFEIGLVRGSVVLTKITFDEGNERDKLLVILNLDCKASDLFFVITTSQIEFFKKKSMIADMARNNSVFVTDGETDVFSLPTVIDLREVRTMNRDEMLKRFASSEMRMIGKLPETIIQSINKIILHSILISPRIKKMIVPGDAD